MELIVTSILAFTSTNIDDIFLLIVFFTNKRFRNHEIVIGQFLGIIMLILISVLLSLIGLVIDRSYVGILGMLPVYFGIRNLMSVFGSNDSPASTTDVTSTGNNKRHVIVVAGTTMANGGDNVGIYVPLFTTLVWSQKLFMGMIFLLMTALWCLLAKYLATRPVVARSLEKYGHVVTPFVLIALGIYILYVSGAYSLPLQWITY